MAKLRFWVSAALLWLAFLLNIERLYEPINIASFVYVMAALMVVITSVLPLRRRWQASALIAAAERVNQRTEGESTSDSRTSRASSHSSHREPFDGPGPHTHQRLDRDRSRTANRAPACRPAQVPLPFAAPEVTVSLIPDPRMDADPAHRWLRSLVLQVCAASRARLATVADLGYERRKV